MIIGSSNLPQDVKATDEVISPIFCHKYSRPQIIINYYFYIPISNIFSWTSSVENIFFDNLSLPLPLEKILKCHSIK